MASFYDFLETDSKGTIATKFESTCSCSKATTRKKKTKPTAGNKNGRKLFIATTSDTAMLNYSVKSLNLIVFLLLQRRPLRPEKVNPSCEHNGRRGNLSCYQTVRYNRGLRFLKTKTKKKVRHLPSEAY